MLSEITDIDERIIAAVEDEPRASLKSIARLAGLSEVTARARLSRLVRRGTVTVRGFGHPLSIPTSLSLSIKLQYSQESEMDVRHSLFDNAHWIARHVDDPTIVTEFYAEGSQAIASLIDDLGQVSGVRTVQASLAYRLHAGPGADGELQKHPGTWRPAPHRPLDDIDFALIRQLGLDGRASYTQLAKVVGLSIPATRRRVVSMSDAGILNFWTIVDRGSTPKRALFNATIEAPLVSEFIDHATRIPGVSYVVELAASNPIVCEVLGADDPSLTWTISRLTQAPGVIDSSVDMIETIRTRPVWGQF